ncbi:MAG: glycosyl transferase family 90 [Flavobacteriaceae bacterium]|nr:glycosyl transferase family 90 [Flavobacteriaceae bacterium]
MNLIKQNKFLFYLRGYGNLLFPCFTDAKKKIQQLKSKFSAAELQMIEQRINYYCQSEGNAEKISQKTFVKDLKKPKTPKAYYFDTYQYARFFEENLPLDFVFGDVIHIPKTPSIVKSRPICNENQNSILLNLDKARHFVWVKNDKNFLSKENKLIGRGAIYGNQTNRIDFYKKYFSHSLCDLGTTNNFESLGWQKPKISIAEHLNFKFILSLQGNDVATNLKWIMSSNSIAVMPKPTIETWFMEGKLEGGKHYIELKPDFSDLEEQLKFYINNPEKCLKIIENAHQHCQKFFNQDMEDLCSLLVLERYFLK